MHAVKTLYVRNVPDDVAADLERLADDAGISVNALVVSELRLVARRSRNGVVLAGLGDHPVDADAVVADVRAGRAR